MSDRIDDVTIVGGGDVGLLTALALRKLNPDLDVQVVDDFSQDIPQVGKSTYLKITDILHGSLDIEESRFVTEVRPVSKASVYFRDWCDYPAFHYPFDASMKFPAPEQPNAVEHYYHYYDEGYADPDQRTICEEIVEQRTSPWYYDPGAGEYDKYDRTAYHLNTERFNSFLREVCRERGVSLVNDAVVDVEVSGDHVDRLRSKSQTYEADLYVDATGFNRVLKARLESEFVDFGFPLDSAFNVRVDRDLDEVVPATVVETGDWGWFWQIDTYDNRDRGYVYASEYVSDEAAREEFIAEVDGDVSPEDVAKYEFSSGYFERAWVGNCVSIGNAQGFVEPLQSTGLTANADAAVQLAKQLSTHGRHNNADIRDAYNEWVSRLWESIYDFISVHYRFSDGDTELWEAMADIDVSPRTDLLIEEYDRTGFNRDLDPVANTPAVQDLETFESMGFYVIMRNMGVDSSFYEDHDFEVSDEVRAEIDDVYDRIKDEVDGYVTTKQLYKGALGL